MALTPVFTAGARYSLGEASKLLNWDIKTLHKRMQLLHIEPQQAPDDRRKLVITGEDVLRLATRFVNPEKDSRAEHGGEQMLKSDSTSEQEKVLAQRITELDKTVRELRDELKQLFNHLSVEGVMPHLDVDGGPAAEEIEREKTSAVEAAEAEILNTNRTPDRTSGSV